MLLFFPATNHPCFHKDVSRGTSNSTNRILLVLKLLWNTFWRHHQRLISSMLKIMQYNSQRKIYMQLNYIFMVNPTANRQTAEKGSLNQVKNQNNLLSPNKFRDKLTFLLGDNMVFWLLNSFSHMCMNM